MEASEIKELYVDRKAQQLKQWDRVIAKIILTAKQADIESKKDLLHHIKTINIKITRIERILKLLRESGNQNWFNIKFDLEIKWKDLRKVILKGSAKAGQYNSTVPHE